MDIGIGLPSTIPGFTGAEVVEWSRRAEAEGFSSLAVLDRLVYGNGDPLTVLAAAASVTVRIGLATTVLVAPYRPSATLLAKQAATVDHLSGGRLTLGLGVGGRADDFEATGASYHDRGQRFPALVKEMRAAWSSPEIGPAQPSIPILLGARADPAIHRVGELADGWIATGGRADMFSALAPKVHESWTAHARPGSPRLTAIAYFALGAQGADDAREHLLDYYDFLGEFARFTAANALTTPEAVRDAVDAFTAAGCDELVLHPCSANPDQVTLLAKALS